MCWHSALIIALFVFLALRNASCDPSVTIEMIPNGDERIVDEGKFSITCRIVLTNYEESIVSYCNDIVEWTLPDVYNDNELKV